MNTPANELFRVAVGHLVKQGDAIGLRPQPHHPRIGESGILDLKQLMAVERRSEAVGFEIDTQAMPGVGLCVPRTLSELMP